MTVLNITPFPLFVTFAAGELAGIDFPDSATFTVAGTRILGITTVFPDADVADLHESAGLAARVNADAVRTADGELRFEYTPSQLAVILDLAEEHGIRAWDAAAFIAQQVFPGLIILDSTKAPVTTLDLLPKHNGVNQRSFHGDSNFPLSVEPPAWFPRTGMPNVTCSGR